jgi:peroxiredoxin-like protein
MNEIKFEVKGTWEGDRNGSGEITTEGFQLKVSAPKELDGPGVGGNPEELLLSAAANCYMITLAAILSNRNVEYSHLEISSEGTVIKEGKRLLFKEILHKPTVIIPKATNEVIDQIEQLTHRAEKACFISQTINDSVSIKVEPTILEK